jgi:hypothetical protein
MSYIVLSSSLQTMYQSINIVAGCQQAVDNLSTSWEQVVRTHPVDMLLEQHCYKSAAGLLQIVRFYVYSREPLVSQAAEDNILNLIPMSCILRFL